MTTLSIEAVLKLSDADLSELSCPELKRVIEIGTDLPDEPADFPGFGTTDQERWTPEHAAWTERCFALSAVAQSAMEIEVERADLKQDARERYEYLPRWHGNGVRTYGRWYACSGHVRVCFKCGDEDHTGDTDWRAHRCPEPPCLPSAGSSVGEDWADGAEGAEQPAAAPLFWFEGTAPAAGEDRPF